jgi:hypothetical protein
MPVRKSLVEPVADDDRKTVASVCCAASQESLRLAVLLGYASWADYERNQPLIADNANGKGMMVRGAVRTGEALLAGLLRCGHCGRRLLVSYNGTKGDIGRYNCDATRSNPGGPPCISFGALRVDEAVGAEVVRLLQPLGVEAAIRAIADSERQTAEKQRQIELALEQARYEAARARRQYDAVDPDNRLVAGELERRWNAALATVDTLENELGSLVRLRPTALSTEERGRLLKLGTDLEVAWRHPAATVIGFGDGGPLRPVLRRSIRCWSSMSCRLMTQGAPLQYCVAGMIPAAIWRSTVMGLRSSILAASVSVTSPRSAHSSSL